MKKKIILGVVSAVILVTGILFGTQAMVTVFAAEETMSITDNTVNGLYHNLNQKILTSYKKDEVKDAGLTVVLPTGYTLSEDVEGMYLSERNPLDSSNIYYTKSEELKADSMKKSLDDGEYKSRLEQGFVTAYGSSAKITEFSYKETKVDGCPAFEISLKCTVEDMEMDQLILMVTADKTYTVTYSQASDDDRMEDFKKSALSAGLVFK